MSALAMSMIISAHATHGLRDGKHVCHATGCPWVYSGSGYPSSQTVSEHVGEVLSAAGFGLVADAGAKALEDAAADFGDTYHGHWLRARAAAVRGES